MEESFNLPHYLKLPQGFLKFYTLMHKIEIHSIAEIGVFFGRSALLFRLFFPKAKLFLIDPWELSEKYLATGNPPSLCPEVFAEGFRTVTQLFAHDPDVQILRRTSKEAAKIIPDDLDLVFIDGDHSYESVKEDIDLWSKKVRPGKILSGHDYDEAKFPQVVKAVNESIPNLRIGPYSTWFTLNKEASSILN